MVFVTFISAGIARSLFIMLCRVGRAEVDYYITLEAFSDFVREVIGIDEITRLRGKKRKRNKGNVLHFVKLLGCLLFQVAVAAAVPFVTLTVRDVHGSAKAMNAINRMLYWKDSSAKSDLQFGHCLSGDSIWKNTIGGWKCERSSYILRLQVLDMNGDNEVLSEDSRCIQTKPMTLSLIPAPCQPYDLFIDIREHAMVELNTVLLNSSDIFGKIGTLSVRLSRHTQSRQAEREKYKRCFRKPTLEFIDFDWGQNSTYDEDRRRSSCVSAVFQSHNSSNPEFVTLKLTQAAISDSNFANFDHIVYPADNKQLQGAVHAFFTYDMLNAFRELTNKIVYKQLSSKDIEYQYNGGVRIYTIFPRKEIFFEVQLVLLVLLPIIYVVLKFTEVWKWGAESDRTKLRRILASIHYPEVSEATSYELRKVRPSELKPSFDDRLGYGIEPIKAQEKASENSSDSENAS